MDEKAYSRWLLQTSRSWEDIKDIVKTTGIIPIDQDHKQLAEYAIELNQLIERFLEEGKSLQSLQEQQNLLQKFLRYTKEHFSREEFLIKKYHIQGLETQQMEHKKVIEKIESTLKSFMEGKIMISISLKMEVLDWIIHHINNIDYSTFNFQNLTTTLDQAQTWDDISIFIDQIGVNFIDHEHRDVTEKVLIFVNSYNKREKRDQVILKYDQFIESITLHFKHEENFIKDYSIDDIDNQPVQHGRFIQKLVSFRKNLESDKSFNIVVFKRAILKWWITHINHTDKRTFHLSKWAPFFFENVKDIKDIDWLLKPTGIEIIDTDHRNVAELTLKIASTDQRTNSEQIKKLFQQLIDQVKAHFAHEEAIIKSDNIKHTEHHLEEHKKLLIKFEELYDHLTSNRLTFNDMIKVQMLEWWFMHTNYTDYKTFCDNNFTEVSGETNDANAY